MAYEGSIMVRAGPVLTGVERSDVMDQGGRKCPKNPPQLRRSGILVETGLGRPQPSSVGAISLRTARHPILRFLLLNPVSPAPQPTDLRWALKLDGWPI